MLAYIGFGIEMLALLLFIAGWKLNKRDLWDYRADALMRSAQFLAIVGVVFCVIFFAKSA